MIGGGLIGCEFANDWSKAGYEVTILEPLDRPLGRMLPPLGGEALAASLRDAGVQLVTGRAAAAIDRRDGGLVVRDDAGEEYPADVVVRAIGLRAHTRLAADAGLATNRAIVTDRFLETSAPGIFALGDCAEVDGIHLPFIMPIQQCARALGPTLAGNRTEVDYPVMPVIAKTPACPVQLYGPPAAVEGEWQEEQVEGGGTRSLFHDRDGNLRGFALTGAAVQEKGHWAKQVPGWFDNR
ncbi:MAG: FAD-dependent oxidoreductase [Halofilum sp. (in: g-proteobacteria)]|nr:FAD-dependent oxidoreductase [Halofilum sp. (in: g-proteobacteria)]